MRLVAPPAEGPVSLDLLKEHARVGHDGEDGILQSYLDAATAHLDGWHGVLGRALVTQTWEVRFDGWQSSFALPFPDVSNVVVTYSDEAGVEQTVADTDYRVVDGDSGPRIEFWHGFARPAIQDRSQVIVRFDAGYGSPDDVPWPIKVAIMHLAAHWYVNREAVIVGTISSATPLAVEYLISPYRRVYL